MNVLFQASTENLIAATANLNTKVDLLMNMEEQIKIKEKLILVQEEAILQEETIISQKLDNLLKLAAAASEIN